MITVLWLSTHASSPPSWQYRSVTVQAYSGARMAGIGFESGDVNNIGACVGMQGATIAGWSNLVGQAEK